MDSPDPLFGQWASARMRPITGAFPFSGPAAGAGGVVMGVRRAIRRFSQRFPMDLPNPFAVGVKHGVE